MFKFNSESDWFHVLSFGFIRFSQRNKCEMIKLFRWSQTWSLIYFSNQIYPVWRRWKRLQIEYYTLSRIGNSTPTHTDMERSTNILRLSIHTQTCIHCIKVPWTQKKKHNFPFEYVQLFYDLNNISCKLSKSSLNSFHKYGQSHIIGQLYVHTFDH